MSVCGLSPPGLWDFVRAAPGNSHPILFLITGYFCVLVARALTRPREMTHLCRVFPPGIRRARSSVALVPKSLAAASRTLCITRKSHSGVEHRLLFSIREAALWCSMLRVFHRSVQHKLRLAGDSGGPAEAARGEVCGESDTALQGVLSCSQSQDLPGIQRHREGPSPPSWSVCQHLHLLYGKKK